MMPPSAATMPKRISRPRCPAYSVAESDDPAEVARPLGDGVGDVRRDRGQAQRDQGGEQDQRAAAGDRVDDPGHEGDAGRDEEVDGGHDRRAYGGGRGSPAGPWAGCPGVPAASCTGSGSSRTTDSRLHLHRGRRIKSLRTTLSCAAPSMNR